MDFNYGKNKMSFVQNSSWMAASQKREQILLAINLKEELFVRREKYSQIKLRL